MPYCHVKDHASWYMWQQPYVGDECSSSTIIVKDTMNGGTVRVCTHHGCCKVDGERKNSGELNLVRDMFAPSSRDYKLKCNGCRAKHAIGIAFAPIVAAGVAAGAVVAAPAAVAAAGGAAAVGHAVAVGAVNAGCNAVISAVIPAPFGAILGQATNLH